MKTLAYYKDFIVEGNREKNFLIYSSSKEKKQEILKHIFTYEILEFYYSFAVKNYKFQFYLTTFENIFKTKY